jgi:DNA-binding transcriptional LysR family regulator
MEMHQIRYFIALSMTFNFTRAAEQCGVSQPSLTRAIQALEAELGGPLFHRERLRTHLTELGRVMLPFMEAISNQAASARSEAEAYRRLESAPLLIGAMCTVGPAIISDLIVKFRDSFPTVEVVVADCTAKSLAEMMRAGELNVALFGGPMPLDPEPFHSLPMFDERFLIVVARGHPFTKLRVVRATDLNDQAYVNRANCEYLDVARAEFAARGVATRRVFSSERDDWVQGMIKAGLGFGFFPEFSVTDPNLVTRPLIEPEFVRTISLVTVRGRPHSPAVGAFVMEASKFQWPKRRGARIVASFLPFGKHRGP